MQATDIIQRSKIIYRLIQNKQLKIALDAIRQWAVEEHKTSILDSLAALEFNYRLLIQYVEQGVDDPQRNNIYQSMLRQAFHMVDFLKEEATVAYGSGYEAEQIRYKRLHSETQDLVATLENLSPGHDVLISLLEEKNQETQKRENREKHEQIRIALFQEIWLSSNMTAGNLKSLFASEFIFSLDKAFFVSALTLSLLRQFSEEKLNVLLDICAHQEAIVRQRALTGLWTIAAQCNDRLPFYPNFTERLQELKDNSGFLSSMKTILMQYIRTSETEKISKKIQEEILPGMMKIAPHLKEKLDMDSWASPEEWEDKNPDWQEMIEQTGVADKLMEMSELQMQGADVYMNAFSHLKQYPFFYTIENWWLPFDKTYSEIADLFDGQHDVFNILADNVFLCNSDKYSLAFSLKTISEKQRESMMQAFKLENEQYKEVTQSSILPESLLVEQLSNQYIQDLYRFFKLNPYREDFYPLFDNALSLHRLWFFTQLEFSTEQQLAIAEFYFMHDHYDEAFEMFEKLIEYHTDKGSLYQKMGYCAQQKGDFQQALTFYLRAEALIPTQKWLTRKIAFCYKMVGNIDDALSYYRRAESLDINNLSIQLQIGHLLMQQQLYEEALNAYFKVELTNSEPKVWRAIAWCSFLCGKKEQAEKYSQKIMESGASTKHDWLNAGHIAWIMGQRTNATERYEKSVQLFRDDHADFFVAFHQDAPFLLKAGIDAMEITFMIDLLRYKLQDHNNK